MSTPEQAVRTRGDGSETRTALAYHVPVKNYLEALDGVATEVSSRPAQRLAMEHKAWSLTG